MAGGAAAARGVLPQQIEDERRRALALPRRRAVVDRRLHQLAPRVVVGAQHLERAAHRRLHAHDDRRHRQRYDRRLRARSLGAAPVLRHLAGT